MILVAYFSVARSAVFLPFFAHVARKVDLVGKEIFPFGGTIGIYVAKIPTNKIATFVFFSAPDTTVLNFEPSVVNDWSPSLGIDERLIV